MLTKLFIAKKPEPEVPEIKKPALAPIEKQTSDWPVPHLRYQVPWLPPRTRLIGLVRNNPESFVLPPAVIRKANWRE
jgi:hypothetical protein